MSTNENERPRHGRCRMIITTALLASTMLGPAGAAAQTFDGRASSRDADIVVSWSVKDGYKISVTIDTRKKKAAFQESTTTDVNEIAVDFVDLNGDSLQDVIIKYEDESSYQPEILINHDGASFVRALTTSFVVWTESDGEPGVPRGKYRLKKVQGRPIPDLIFPDVVIGRERYRDATFRLDPATGKYSLLKKGAKLGPLGGS